MHHPRRRRRFPSRDVAAIIREVFKLRLESNPDYDQDLGYSIARDIRDRLKGPLRKGGRAGLGPSLEQFRPRRLRESEPVFARPELELPRYKYMVQVVVGENSGEGVRVGTRCLWDASTDGMAHESMTSDKLFVTAMAFGVYLY
ncbi:DYNLT2B [Symbiodinium sp. KB8]|nr:DYNLT2B [Symbiodinium sp. KB8]